LQITLASKKQFGYLTHLLFLRAKSHMNLLHKTKKRLKLYPLVSDFLDKNLK